MDLHQDQTVTVTDFIGQTHQYAVVCALGDGYLADVYLVQDRQADAPVVLKLLKERYLEADHRASEFLREADVLQQLIHLPAVVNPWSPSKGDFILEKNVRIPCTLQEYVGESYRALPALVEQGLDEQTGVAICRQFATLLDEIHSQNIVYADLKPEHIYWDGSRIKVIDWNVVKDLSGSDHEVVREAIDKEIRAFGQAMYYMFTGHATVSRADGPSMTALISGDFANTHVDFTDSTTGTELSVGTKLVVERSLSDGRNGFASAAALKDALTQQLTRLSQAPAEPMPQTRAALSKGLAALEAADYEDAITYFTEAIHSSPGLITQSYLVATRIQRDDDLPDLVKDQVEEILSLFRVSLQEGDLNTALDALASGQTALPENREIEVLNQLTSQLVDTIARADEALAEADYATAQQALRSALSLEPSAPFLQERLQTVEAFQSNLRRGTEALEAGQFSEAAAAFETLLDHMPQSATIEERWVASRLGHGQTALARNAFHEARSAFEAVLERRPGNKDAEAGLDAVGVGQQRMQQLESWLVQGRTAFQVGDYDKALEFINDVLELEPEHEDARQLLTEVQQARQAERSKRVQRLLEKGHQAMAGDDFAEAIHCFEQAAALDPESEANILRARAEAAQARTDQFQALLHKAHAAFRGEDYDTAVHYFEEAVDLFPEMLDARRGLTLARQRQAEARTNEVQNLMAGGRAALSAGNYDEALKHFERAAELGSDAETADYIEKTFQIRDLVQNAQHAEARGELQEALKCYARAVNVEALPGLESQLARLRAEVHAATEEQVNWLVERATTHIDDAPEQALVWLEQACELDPHHSQATELRVEAKETLQRRKQQARQLLETGKDALHAGDASAARRAFSETLDLFPDLAEARAGQTKAQELEQHMSAARIANDNRNYEEAISQLEKALDVAPESPGIKQRWRTARCEALLKRANQASADGAYDDALIFIDEALRLDPDHTRAHELREKVQTDAETARLAAEQATHQAKLREVEELKAAAQSKIEAGDFHAALQALEDALELMPGNAELAQRRQYILQQKGRQDRARGLINDARRLETGERFAEAAETYEIAAHLTPDASLEAEAYARADQARQKQRQQRWVQLVRRVVGFSMADTQADTLGKDQA